MQDASSTPPSSTFARGLKAASALGKVALSRLEQKLGRNPDPDKLAVILTETLGELKGPAMKIGQILATVPGMLPPAYAEAFLQLTNNAPAMGPLFVKRRMTAELGENWKEHFHDFPLQPAFAASLGQVHKATLTSGEVVALKLQYPQMDEVLKTDLAYLSVLCKLYERYNRALATQNLQEELRERLFEELDYEKEADHIRWFTHCLHDEPHVRLPTVYPELSTKRLLTLSWLAGKPLLDFSEAPLPVKEKLARSLFRAWWRPFYQAGLIHGDPHLGNYTVCPDAHALNLLDFGCIRVFAPKVVMGLYQLFEGLQKDDTALLLQAYANLGFANLTPALLDALNPWARFLYAPLLKDKTCLLTEDPGGDEGRRIAMEVHQRLQAEGGVTPPRTFVFLDRAAVGIGSALIRLNVPMNWHRLFRELTDGLSEQKIARAQKKALAAKA